MASEASTKKRKASNPSAASESKEAKKAKKTVESVSSVQNVATSVGETIISAGSTAAQGPGGSKSKKSKGKKDAQTAKISKKRSADSMAADANGEMPEVDESSVVAVSKKSKKQKKASTSNDTGVVANARDTLADSSTQVVDAADEKTPKSKNSKKEKKAKVEDDEIDNHSKIRKAAKTKKSMAVELVSTTPIPVEKLAADKGKAPKEKNTKKSRKGENLIDAIGKSDETKNPEVRLQTLDELVANRGLLSQPVDATPSEPARHKSKSKKANDVDVLSVAKSSPLTKKQKSKKTKVIDQNTPDAQNLAELAQAVTASQDDCAGASNSESEADIEEDDQTAELLKGFESDNEEEASGDEGYTPFKPIPLLDQDTTKQVEKINSAKKADTQGPGVVYLGCIPHGFYEREMRAYFTQFGRITKLRLSRNRATGASKHYAFIEFASADVASIVAKTMDSYLLFNHILKCRVVPREQVHEKLFIGANKKFKQVPWNKIEGRKLEQGKTRESWDGKVARENRKRSKKREALREIGYEYEAPELKTTKAIPIRDSAAAAADTTDIAAIETGNVPEESAPKAIENGEVDKVEEESNGKKKKKNRSKKGGKGKGEGKPAVEIDGSGISDA